MENQTSRRLKIIYVITKSNWGGAQKYVFDLASAVSKTHDVAVALGGTGARGACVGPLAEKLEAAGIRTVFIPSLERNIAGLKEFKVLFDLISLFRKEKPDVVHLNSSKVGGTGSLAGRITGVPKIIFTVHGWAFNEPRNILQKLLIRLASALTILFSTDIIAISSEIKKEAPRVPGASKKMHVIYNGIDTAMQFLADGSIKKSFPAGSVVVGTIGELHKNKNQDLLIPAAKNLNIAVAIIGEGERRSALEKQIAHSGLASRIKLFGFMPSQKAMPEFDIFALPSIKEGLPYSILEAGLAEKPVIATNVGGNGEIIEDKKSGLLIPPNDVHALSQAIEYLISNPSSAKAFAAALRNKVLSKFSFRTVTLPETLRVYAL